MPLARLPAAELPAGALDGDRYLSSRYSTRVEYRIVASRSSNII